MKSVVHAGLGVMCLLGVAVGSAEATTMDFTGGSGGSLVYGGGSNRLDGIDLTIGSVAVGVSSTAVTGGLLNFNTGAWDGAVYPPDPGIAPGGLWKSFFKQEGSTPITITGEVAAAGITPSSTLLTAMFDLNHARFTYFSDGTGTVEAPGLAITYVNPDLLTYFGLTGSSLSSGVFNLSIGNFVFGVDPPTEGANFTAGNNSSSFVATVATPEPASALLLGSGMIGVFAWGRKKLTKEMASPLA